MQTLIDFGQRNKCRRKTESASARQPLTPRTSAQGLTDGDEHDFENPA